MQRSPVVVVTLALALASCGDDADVGGPSGSSDGSSSGGSDGSSSTTDGPKLDVPGGDTSSGCPDDWFDTNWTRRSWITIDNANGGQFDNFPLLLTFEGLDLQAARIDGFDLRFRNTANLPMTYDLDSFDSATGGVAWVQVNLMPGDATPGFYVYYGATVAGNGEAPNLVWADAAAVWHMGQAIEGVLDDDGPNGIDGTSENTTSMAGQIALARRFTASDGSRIDFGEASAALGSGWTELSLSMWVYPDYDADADWTTPGLFLERGDSLVGGQLRRDDGQAPDLGLFEFEVGYGEGFTQAASIELPRQQWTWVGVDFDGSAVRTYVNGAMASQVAAVADTLGSGPGSLVFGAETGGFDGIVDEVRVYQASQPAAWYDANYRSMTDAIVTYGEMETCGG